MKDKFPTGDVLIITQLLIHTTFSYKGIQSGAKRDQPVQTLTSRCWSKETVMTTFS